MSINIDFGTALNAVMNFIGNSHDVWVSGDLNQKRLVQKLVFRRPLVIDSSQAIGTADLSLPFSMLKDILTRKHNANSSYVFPGTGADGYIIEPRKQMAKVIDDTKIQFTVHDLRRTFITMAESLDIAAYALKRLLNHKMNGDVTAGYIMFDVERLRKPMQMITDHLLRQMIPSQSPIISLPQTQKSNIKLVSV